MKYVYFQHFYLQYIQAVNKNNKILSSIQQKIHVYIKNVEANFIKIVMKRQKNKEKKIEKEEKNEKAQPLIISNYFQQDNLP